MKLTKRHIKKEIANIRNVRIDDVTDTEISLIFGVTRAAVGKWGMNEELPKLRQLEYLQMLQCGHLEEVYRRKK
jgi:DNA-binding transcriptional regulator YiaG